MAAPYARFQRLSFRLCPSRSAGTDGICWHWSEGEEQEKELWIIPVNGKGLRRVGTFLCHAAAWTADEQRIVYSFGNAVYLTSPDGGDRSELYTFTTIPQELHWSLDGRRLIVRLRDDTTGDSAIWELALRSDRLAVTSVRLLSRLLGTMSRFLLWSTTGTIFSWESRTNRRPSLWSTNPVFRGRRERPLSDSRMSQLRPPILPWTELANDSTCSRIRPREPN